MGDSNMSHVENCPQCGGKCKTEVDRDTGEVRYKALQDADAIKKIEQLKQQLVKQIEKNKAAVAVS
jgi:hypothetical protein